MSQNFQQLIDNITPEIYSNLKTAVEIGRWPTGVKLTRDQRHLSMQAIIAYEVKHFAAEARSGYIPPVKNTPCKDAPNPDGHDKNNGPAAVADDQSKPLTWV